MYLLYKWWYLYTDCIYGGTCVIIIMAWLHTPRLVSLPTSTASTLMTDEPYAGKAGS